MDRFYVVRAFILPTLDDIKILPFPFDQGCSYLNVQLERRIHVLKQTL